MQESFDIVPFEPHHQEGVKTVAEEILCREYEVQANLSEDEDLLDTSSAYPEPGSRFLVAIVAGKVVATAGVARLSGTDCELRRLYVQAAHRRRGIATALVAMLLTFVRERGYRRVLLEIRPEMRDTVKSYSRYGFTPEEENLPRPGIFMAIHM